MNNFTVAKGGGMALIFCLPYIGKKVLKVLKPPRLPKLPKPRAYSLCRARYWKWPRGVWHFGTFGRGAHLVAKALEAELGVKLERNLEQSRNGGCDLRVLSDCVIANRLNRFSIECKRYRQATDGLISDWWQRTLDQAEKANKTPLLAFRADRQQWCIIVPLREISNHLPDQYPDIDWTAWLSVPAFGALMREYDNHSD